MCRLGKCFINDHTPQLLIKHAIFHLTITEVPAEEGQGPPGIIHPTAYTPAPLPNLKHLRSGEEDGLMDWQVRQQSNNDKSRLGACKSLQSFLCPVHHRTGLSAAESLIQGTHQLTYPWDEAVVEIYHPEEILQAFDLAGLQKGGDCLHFTWKGNCPFKKTWWPRKSITDNLNWHLAGFKVSPCSCKHRNNWCKCHTWPSMEGLPIRISSKEANTNGKSHSIESIRSWNVCVAPLRPKDIHRNSNRRGDNGSFGHIR